LIDEATKGRGVYLAYITERLDIPASQSLIADVIKSTYAQSHSAEAFSCAASIKLDALHE